RAAAAADVAEVLVLQAAHGRGVPRSRDGWKRVSATKNRVMSLRWLTWLAALCAVAASAATCAQAAPGLTVSQYRHEANAICSDFNAFTLPAHGPLVDRLEALVDKGRGSVAALRRLRPPQSLAKLHSQIV